MNSTVNRGTGGRIVDDNRHNRLQICSENKIIKTTAHSKCLSKNGAIVIMEFYFVNGKELIVLIHLN